jgi:hypothetical protein
MCPNEGIMKDSKGLTFASSSTGKGSPETLLTYQDVLELLDIKEIPGTQVNKDFTVRVMNIALQEKGLEWIKANRAQLIHEMEMMTTMMG